MRQIKNTMHPHTFYANLFEHQKRDEVFVIMSFAPEFEPRWCDIIEPCIREDLGLTANRVDYSNSGESVIHDILDGLAHAKVVVADITSIEMFDKRGNKWAQRNGNVMWELGIAHVMRMPDEVIVIRSDSEPSIFDLTQFRAFSFDPHDAREGRRVIASLVRDRIRAVAGVASDHVRRCASSLDLRAWTALFDAAESDGIPPKGPKLGVRSEIDNIATTQSIARLLEMGALATTYVTPPPGEGDPSMGGVIKYTITNFGRAILAYSINELGFRDLQLLNDVLTRE